jgi:lantibiotic modifying enzyme
MLYEPERHEPLCTNSWDETQVLNTIQKIVTDVQERFDAVTFWPTHPLDRDVPDLSYKSLYAGAAGVIWALHYLSKAIAVSVKRDYVPLMKSVHEAYLSGVQTDQSVQHKYEVVPSYFLGEVGILLADWRLSPATDTSNRLFTLIRDNIKNPSNELYWAAPGTMIGALFMYEWTGESRWQSLFLENVEHLWSEWEYASEYGCYLWTQFFYGHRVKHIGAAHGFAGNVYPLLRGAPLLPESQRQELYRRCLEVMEKVAHIEGAYANWPQSVGKPRPGRTAMLVQWCHGSPGMLTSLCYFPKDYESGMERLFLAAGELIWKAGPLKKALGGLCHGTAGNGYAFLKLYKRTGDVKWLDRARAFGMHAIEQYEQMWEQYGQGRYSLWIGDLGVAVYLWHCITEEAALPGLDIL